MTVHCRNCGQEWEADPRLAVPCPSCPADAGDPCRRPSEHRCAVHVEREQTAIDAGEFSATCPAISGEGDTEQPDPDPPERDQPAAEAEGSSARQTTLGEVA